MFPDFHSLGQRPFFWVGTILGILLVGILRATLG
jgi:hypothetical protein